MTLFNGHPAASQSINPDHGINFTMGKLNVTSNREGNKDVSQAAQDKGTAQQHDDKSSNHLWDYIHLTSYFWPADECQFFYLCSVFTNSWCQYLAPFLQNVEYIHQLDKNVNDERVESWWWSFKIITLVIIQWYSIMMTFILHTIIRASVVTKTFSNAAFLYYWTCNVLKEGRLIVFEGEHSQFYTSKNFQVLGGTTANVSKLYKAWRPLVGAAWNVTNCLKWCHLIRWWLRWFSLKIVGMLI